MDINLALISLAALAAAIAIGCIFTKANTGIISVSFALGVGILLAGMKAKDITSYFPGDLFLMLAGITLMFSFAQLNGTLDKITKYLISLVGGNPSLFPLFFFALAFFLSSAGPGNIAAVALIAPLGMAISHKAGISPLLMGIMICTGANAGAFSPISPTGIIMSGLASDIGIAGKNINLLVYISAALIQGLTALGAYFIFKGHKNSGNGALIRFLKAQKREKLDKMQAATLTIIILFIASVSFLKMPIVLGAFFACAALAVLGSDSEEAIKNMPWGAIVLVTGVTVLVGLLEKTGGLDLATASIARYSSSSNINFVLAMITGLISAYSSSSGVVMPTFIPLIPKLREMLGGGDPVEMLISVSVGSHMVDVSPLSTLGAIVIASYQSKEGRPALYRNFLIWGLCMAIVGAALSYIFLDLL